MHVLKNRKFEVVQSIVQLYEMLHILKGKYSHHPQRNQILQGGVFEWKIQYRS